MKHGETVDLILRLIVERGPMTRAELEEAIGIERGRISSIITRMSNRTKTLPKRLYICGYVYDHGKSRRYPRAVFNLGDKRDKRKPKSSRQEIRKRYDDKVRMLMTGSSIFNLGMSRKQYLAKRRAINEQA